VIRLQKLLDRFWVLELPFEGVITRISIGPSRPLLSDDLI
jgi:hypothetical protein